MSVDGALPRLDVGGYVAHIAADGARFAEVLRRGPLDASVTACAPWTLADLAGHLGFVHRWARLAVVRAARPASAEIETAPEHPDALVEWFTDGVLALERTLSTLDPDAPTWHPFLVPKVAGVWPRRQAQETVIHRWDAEAAVGATTPIDPLLAADGIAEYVEVIVPRKAARDGAALPRGTVVVELTDLGRSLAIVGGAGTPSIAPETAGSTAKIRGRAEDVLLALWGRCPLDPPAAGPVAAAWLALGGN